MKLILSKEIDERLLTRIEFLHHKRMQFSLIMNEVLRKRSPYKYDKENIDYYLEKSTETNSEFMLLTNEIIAGIDKKYADSKKYQLEYDFEKGVINIYEN